MKTESKNLTLERIVETRFQEKNWLSTEDLSQIFECSEKSIQSWIKEKLKNKTESPIPHFKLGKEFRFPKDELVAWLSQNKLE